MDTLVRDTHTPEQAPAPPPEQTPPAGEPAPRACAACGSAMAPGQDWCLECGTAAPGRLGRRPGLRAAATVVGLTLALVVGAVTAGYAALSGDAGRDVQAPAAGDGAPVAQAPPATPPAPAPPAPAPPVAPAAPLPKVSPPASPAPPAPAAPANPAPAAPAPPAPSAGKPHKPAANTAPQPISFDADAASLYDPYNRATDKGDPADATDGDNSTAWKVTTGPGQAMQVGYVVDLSKKRSLRQLDFRTSTPGFRVEIYAANAKEVPPDILDTRWAHLKNRSSVAKSESVDLGAGAVKYRFVLLWITTPPPDGPTAKINELSLKG